LQTLLRLDFTAMQPAGKMPAATLVFESMKCKRCTAEGAAA
jgi:hypothetical protein